MTKPLVDIYRDHMQAAGLDPDPEQAAVMAALEPVRAAVMRPHLRRASFPGRRRGPSSGPAGAYVWGDVGRGKSMLVDLFVGSVGSAPKCRRHFHDFMQQFHRALHKARREGATDPVAVAAERTAGAVRLLALDEMEVTDIVDAMLLGRILDHVIGAGVVVIIASNRAPSDLYHDGLKRDLFVPCIRLMETRLRVQHLGGSVDYRFRSTPDPSLYLTPDDADARARMDSLWAAVSGGRQAVLNLHVGGRRLSLASDGGKAVRATFDQLCKGELGSADYIALAAEIDILFLDSIPRMAKKDRDAARRLIILIDVLYDTGKGLVASAADSPEQLYTDPEAEGFFAFRRTASRLREMQSPRWPGLQALRQALAQ